MQSLAELATDEQHCRESSLDTTAIIDGARLDVGFPNGTSATITLTVAADGRVTWQAPDVDLAPIDGPTHLGLTTALTQLGETLTKALPESAFEEQWRAGMTTQRLTPARVTLLRAVADGKVDRLGSCAYYAELGGRRRQRVTERVRTPDEAGLINPLGVAMKGGKPMPPQERFRGETVRPTCDADQRR